MNLIEDIEDFFKDVKTQNSEIYITVKRAESP
jgi:hypothetical protein